MQLLTSLFRVPRWRRTLSSCQHSCWRFQDGGPHSFHRTLFTFFALSCSSSNATVHAMFCFGGQSRPLSALRTTGGQSDLFRCTVSRVAGTSTQPRHFHAVWAT
uniref:(northern house mosquito) hypothetical protein n=1 Tax=Culex pipiens TaxID=7175 RepID=A0A8D8FPJ6_CULPI